MPNQGELHEDPDEHAESGNRRIQEGSPPPSEQRNRCCHLGASYDSAQDKTRNDVGREGGVGEVLERDSCAVDGDRESRATQCGERAEDGEPGEKPRDHAIREGQIHD